MTESDKTLNNLLQSLIKIFQVQQKHFGLSPIVPAPNHNYTLLKRLRA